MNIFGVSTESILECFTTLTSGKNASGILFMLLSMSAFALTDTLVKVSSSFLSPAQILFFLMGGGLVIFAAMAKIKGETMISRNAIAPIMLLRYFSEITGMVGMVMALSFVPLSTVGAITQAAPMLVTVGAIFFLGEKVSWRRWTSIAVGFLGVLLIVQPGTEGFNVSVLWAVLAMVGMAIRDLTTRLTPSDVPSTSLATYTMVASLPFAIGWVFYNGERLIPVETDWLIATPMIILGAVGYLLLIASIRVAEVSVVTPFRYSRIIFLLVLGVIVFQERPSATMLTGAALIIVSGVYLVWREHRVRKLGG
ncbi:MAG: DMT family transporter [Pseudomonadota bacterium]